MPIRLATTLDHAAIAALVIAFRNHLQRTAPSDQALSRSVERLLASGDAEFCLFEADVEGAADGARRVLGYVLLRFRESMWASGTEATLEDLFVDPAARQGGVGRQLVQFAVQRARDRTCTTLCLDTNENNIASQRIYQAIGFSAFSPRWQGQQIFYRLGLG